jgi:hypothetical protein
MKLMMSTAVAAVVLTVLATGLGQAQIKDYETVRYECRSEVHRWGGMPRSYVRDRYNPDPINAFNAVRECIQARGYVPRLPPR